MFTEAKKIIKIFKRYFKLNLAAQMEYRVSFIVQVFGMVINNASFVIFWGVLFSAVGGNIAGYTMRDVMFLWAVASSAFGLAYVLFYNVSRISQLIITGELDTYLLQPVPVLANILGASTQVSAWGDFVYGWILLFIFWGFDLHALFIFIPAVIIGAVVFTGLQIFVHTLTFYLGNAQMLAGSAFEFMINFSIYPEGIFDGFVKVLMYSVLPAAFVTQIPLKLVTDFSLGTLAVWVAGALLYSVITCVFFHRGLKRYESGNLIVTRM